MPATGWTTSSSRSSVSPLPPSPPPRSPRRLRSRNRRPRRPWRPSPSSSPRFCWLPCWSPCCWSPLSGLVSGLVSASCWSALAWSPSASALVSRTLVSCLFCSEPPPAEPASREAPRRSRRCCVCWSSTSAALGVVGRGVGGRRIAYRAAVLDVIAGTAVGLAPALTYRGDEFALAHTGRAFDADFLGERAQFGQHHRRQATPDRSPEATSAVGAVSAGGVARGRVLRGRRSDRRVSGRGR